MTGFDGVGGVTVKLDALRTVPVVVETLKGPVLAPAGTNVVSWPVLSGVNDDAAAPVNITDVTPVNPEPVTVTRVPTGPARGEKLAIVGAWGNGVTVNQPELVAGGPTAVATVI